VPAAAVPGWRVSVVSLPLPATLVGLKLALAPAGVPDAARLTVLENPLKGETVIFEVAAAPAFEVTDVGFAVIEKSGPQGS